MSAKPDSSYRSRPAAATSILLISTSSGRDLQLHRHLLEFDYQVTLKREPGSALLGDLQACDADLLVMALQRADAGLLQQLLDLQALAPLPVVIFAADDSPELLEDIIAAGVSAYIVGEFQYLRLPAILDVAMARFAERQAIYAELHEARKQLQERKLTERAKGLLMEKQRLTEQQAHRRLNKLAMDRGVSLAALAEQVVRVLA